MGEARQGMTDDTRLIEGATVDANVTAIGVCQKIGRAGERPGNEGKPWEGEHSELKASRWESRNAGIAFP
jgi:hypothetical protein